MTFWFYLPSYYMGLKLLAYSRSVVYDQDGLYRVIDGQWGGILLHSFLVHHIFKIFKNWWNSIEIRFLLEESKNDLKNNLENP